MHEYVTKLKAPENARLYIWFEPWAEGLGFPPGCVVELRGVSPIQGALEIEVAEERTAVYGWPGSTLKVIVDGEIAHAFDQPVPDAGRLSTKGLITMLFGPAPVPEPTEKERSKKT
jgi:hypothetical protein